MLKNAGIVCLVLCIVPVLTHLAEGAQAGTGNNLEEPVHTITLHATPPENASTIPDFKPTSRQSLEQLHAEQTPRDPPDHLPASHRNIRHSPAPPCNNNTGHSTPQQS
jgi:hypothetical protein